MIYIAIVLFVLAICAFIVSAFLKEGVGFVRLGGVGGIILTLVFGGLSSAATVQPGHVGVPILFGSVQEYTYDEGFHFVNPFAIIEEMSIQTETVTMANESSLHAMSSDQLSMTLDVSVLYHLNPAEAPGVRRFMPTYRSRVVEPSVRTAVREAVREFDAVAAVSTSRDELGTEMIRLVRSRIANALEQRELESLSIHIDDVQLRNISLPPEIRESIAQVQRQRQLGNEREQSIRTANQEAERATAEAEGQRRVAIIQAQRDAESRLIRVHAEAEANRALNASLTPLLLRLRAIQATQAITTNEHTRTVILGSGDSQTPLIMNLGQ